MSRGFLRRKWAGARDFGGLVCGVERGEFPGGVNRD